jgi:WhiB family redox-sensing transcriptional regulator
MHELEIGSMTIADGVTEDGAAVWIPEGNCRNYTTDAFFPADGVGVDRARKICASCPVIDYCLEYALKNRIEHGVWGGASERERRRILKRRRAWGGPSVQGFLADAEIGEF